MLKLSEAELRPDDPHRGPLTPLAGLAHFREPMSEVFTMQAPRLQDLEAVRITMGRPETEPTVRPPRDLRDIIPRGKGRVGVDEYLARVRRGQLSGMQSMLLLHQHARSEKLDEPAEIAIVGGGPSLQACVGELRKLAKRGVKILAVNKSHDWLLRRGFPVHYAALLDPKEWVADYIDTQLPVSRETKKRLGKQWVRPKYLIASQCHDDTIAKFLAPDVRASSYMWHAAGGVGESEMLRTEFAKELWVNIAGASVIGLRAVGLAHGLGYRKLHLFGIDGSSLMPPDDALREVMKVLQDTGFVKKREREPTVPEILETLKALADKQVKFPPEASELLKRYMYAYSKPKTEPTWSSFRVGLTSGWSRTFLSNHHMARSVYEFEDAMKDWDAQIKAGRMEPFGLRVHGDPEHSAIALVAAGMGVHIDDAENEKYGKPPVERAA